MIIYNVTVKINRNVHDDWYKWMCENHIPDVMKTGFFIESRMQHLVGQDDPESITYAIQYSLESMADLHRYQVNHAPALQKEHKERYDNQYVAFRTLMRVVETFEGS